MGHQEFYLEIKNEDWMNTEEYVEGVMEEVFGLEKDVLRYVKEKMAKIREEYSHVVEDGNIRAVDEEMYNDLILDIVGTKELYKDEHFYGVYEVLKSVHLEFGRMRKSLGMASVEKVM